MSNYDTLVSRLQHARSVPPREGQARAHRAMCPVCERKNLSLSVAESADGGILIHCFGGCSSEAIVSRTGLSLVDLFPPERAFKRSVGHLGPRAWGSIPLLIDDALQAHKKALAQGDLNAALRVHDVLIELKKAIHEAMRREMALRKKLATRPARSSAPSAPS